MNKNKFDLHPGPRLHPNGLINNLKLLLYYGISDSINVIQILYSGSEHISYSSMHRSHSRPSIEMCTLPNGNGIKFPGQSGITECFAKLDTQLFMISIRKAIYEKQEEA
ncbi:hypothetical protein V1478_003609 [Vespula squamosa]|uniref:Uncharacterized protein n=1 Tax=Vespula squamosa TaxID=30214 RepID=A0ABD2BMC7_VESSQ